METLQKFQTNAHAPREKPASAQKKILLGLELDMASLCRLVGVCGRCVAKKHSGTEASRRGKKWMGGCLPGMIENHDVRCSNVFFYPLKSKIDSLRRRNANFDT